MTTRWGAPLDADDARLRDDVAKVKHLADSFLLEPLDRPRPISDGLRAGIIGAALLVAVALLIGCAIGAAGHGHPLFVVQSVFVAGVVIIVLASAVTHR